MDSQKLEWMEVERRNRISRGTRGYRADEERESIEFQEIDSEELQRLRRNRQRRLRQKRQKRIQRIRRMIALFLLLAAIGLICGIVIGVKLLVERKASTEQAMAVDKIQKTAVSPAEENKWEDFYAASLSVPAMDVQLLTINEFSRPGELLPKVKNIFIHYTANPGTDAEQNRNYFQSLADTRERSASTHFIIGYEGEIVQCIPTREIAYAVMKRNYDSISIECCYVDESGKFTDATYDSLIQLTAWLLHKYELTPEDVLRHYDVGGKNCPKYYVENEEEWEKFLLNLGGYMEDIAQAHRNSVEGE